MIDALAPIALCVMGVIAWSIPRGWREDNEKLNQIPDGSRPREGSGAVSLSGPGAAHEQHGSDIS